MADQQANNMASVPAVSQFLRCAAAFDIDVEPLLEQTNIAPEILTDNSKYVPMEAMEALLSLLISKSNNPYFGLCTASFVEPASYSALGYIALSCSTLRDVQAKIPIYEKLVGDMGVTTVKTVNTHVLQQWQCAFSDPLTKRHETENVLGSWFTYSKRYLNFIECKEIWFEHSEPNNDMSYSQYREVFDCPVRFNQSSSGLLFDSEVLDHVLPQANNPMLVALLDHASTQLAEIEQQQTMSLRVINLLRLTLKSQKASSTYIAEKLAMSSRTLQRKLEDEGTQFKQLLSQLRLELALHYLQKTEMSLDAIACELGFKETRSFHRSFKEWTGRTAGSYRES